MTATATIDQLRPGHEYPGANLNARTTGRDLDIDALAASIKAEGVLQSLLVAPGPNGDKRHFYVIAGNRRLAALRKLKWDGEIPVIVREDATPGSALAMSLAENVTQCPLHPIDRFEAFAALIAAGKTEDDIATSYAIGKRTVQQSLALGRLSPKVRAAWRKGEIDAAAAKQFTLASDPKEQDAIFERLKKRHALYQSSVREEIVGDQSGMKKFLTFVGRAAYEKAGGKIQADLFANRDHRARDEADDDGEEYDHDGTGLLVLDKELLIRLAGEKIKQKCDELVADGWAWAMDIDDAPPSAKYNWRRIENASRSASAAQKKSAGCFVGVNYDGKLEIDYGFLKPGDRVKEPGTPGEKKHPKPSNALSNSLKSDLEAMAARATRDALQEIGKEKGIFGLLARIVAAQIQTERLMYTAEPVRKQLDELAEQCWPKVHLEAMRRRFDRQRYFQSAPKGHVIRAVTESVSAEQGKKLAGGTKAAAWKFALANVPKTWLPPELRTSHYAGPGAKAAKKAKAAKPARRKKAAA